MSIIGSNLLAGASGQGGYTIEESLRFNASQSSYLSRAQGSATSTTTGTWSGWCKRGKLGAQQYIWSSSNYDFLRFDASDTITIAYLNNAGYVSTAAVYRDPSAWYHIVLVFDTTNATAVDRMRLYVNGVQQTLSWGATPQTQNATFQRWNVSGYTGDIGDFQFNHSNLFDGYMAECYWVDGQALAPSSFGEFDSVTGVWQPVAYEGTYGNNGFYLPMKLDNTTEGFNTVTYIGTGSKQQISGVGFSPDLVWGKSRNTVNSHSVYDSVRGTGLELFTDTADVEVNRGTSSGVQSFDTDGFSVAGAGNLNTSGNNYVAWCWDAGDTTVSNTDGSITSSVRANPAYGFSVVTYTGTGANATVGHGLGAAPKMIIVKNRTGTARNWAVYNANLPIANGLLLDATSPSAAYGFWNGVHPTSAVFSISADLTVNTNGDNLVAYCFSEVSGYSKFGSYTGTGAAGNAVTTGFKPAFVMIKSSNNVTNWMVYDATRDGTSSATKYLTANTSGAEGTLSPSVEFTSTGFTVNYNASPLNSSGDTYIYMAFADTREYAFWLDDSSNNNDWQPNGGITTDSTVTDTPTPYADGGNYAVLNPLASPTVGAFTEGNLTFTSSSASAWQSAISTIGATSGKWYFEATAVAITGSNLVFVGAAKDPFTNYSSYLGSDSNTWGVQYGNGDAPPSIFKYNNGSGSLITAGSIVAGDIIQCAIDLDTGSIWFGKNNTWAEGDPAAGTGASFTNLTGSVHLGVSSVSTGNKLGCNFGQRPFAYTPPTGFLPLHTGNLPDSAIVDGSKYFAATTWTSAGGTETISNAVNGVSFQPDFLWMKNRSIAQNHYLVDSNRGTSKILVSNTTSAEITDATFVTSFNSDGFSLGAGGFTAGQAIVGWNWKANGAGVSNTDGSITSTVSANPTAGFSIVSYTGTGSAATVGHGLGVAPKVIIVKDRVSAGEWYVYTEATGPSIKLNLHLTAGSTSTGAWANTSPTSSVFTQAFGTNAQVAYCFAEVESYSKFGSYLGNGSTDGTFVHLGFRPKFILVKCSNGAFDWHITDTSRSTYNQADTVLFPNSSAAETNGGGYYYDILSNGFKCRNLGAATNGSGYTYIYMAFAENPFKNSLAR